MLHEILSTRKFFLWPCLSCYTFREWKIRHVTKVYYSQLQSTTCHTFNPIEQIHAGLNHTVGILAQPWSFNIFLTHLCKFILAPVKHQGQQLWLLVCPSAWCQEQHSCLWRHIWCHCLGSACGYPDRPFLQCLLVSLLRKSHKSQHWTGAVWQCWLQTNSIRLCRGLLPKVGRLCLWLAPRPDQHYQECHL